MICHFSWSKLNSGHVTSSIWLFIFNLMLSQFIAKKFDCPPVFLPEKLAFVAFKNSNRRNVWCFYSFQKVSFNLRELKITRDRLKKWFWNFPMTVGGRAVVKINPGACWRIQSTIILFAAMYPPKPPTPFPSVPETISILCWTFSSSPIPAPVRPYNPIAWTSSQKAIALYFYIG